GDDTLEGRGGNDTLTGGNGSDTASYASSLAGVTVDLSLAGAQVGAGDAVGDVLIGVENVSGSGLGDTLRGDGASNVLSGNAGDDLLVGGGGADTLQGGSGYDTASYASSTQAVVVDLTLTAGQTGSGDVAGDVLSSIESLIGTGFADTLRGDGANNLLTGADGNDTLEGRGGVDTLDGGAGIDTASYASSAAGVTIDLAASGGQASAGDGLGDVLIDIENLLGSNQADTLRGDAAANLLTGGLGNDVLEGRAGADTLQGGDGSDTASYSTSTAAVVVDLATVGAQTGAGDVLGDVYDSIENLAGSEYADTLRGNDAGNALWGGGGDDLLEGRGGADTLDGGAGTDTATYANATVGMTVNLSSGSGQFSAGEASGDVLVSVENLIGSTYADLLSGSSANNSIVGGLGDDTIEGRAGADTLVGGVGTDTASYANAAGAVSVSLATVGAQGGATEATGDLLSQFENLEGSAFGDLLAGDAAANRVSGLGGDDTISGAAGNDTLQGGDGDDVLQGGAGADTLEGGAGADAASYAGATAAVTVDLGLTTAQTGSGDVAGDVFVDIENLIGSGFADRIVSGAAANGIDGGAGIDTVSYANSDAGVSVDLTVVTGQLSSGHASGDLLTRVENLLGSAYSDTLRGDGAANLLTGGAGNDVLEGRTGADTLDGGDGSDWASYANAGTAVTVDLGLSSPQTGSGDALGDVFVGIENVQGSAHGDRFFSGAGANAIDGGGGNDTADYSNSAAAVRIDLALGDPQLGGLAEGDLLTGIESLVGSNHGDQLAGDALGNSIEGGLGNDTIEGRAGADTLAGGDGIDTASYAQSGAGVTVDLTLTGAQLGVGDAFGDRLSGFENLSGSSLDDLLRGDTAANLLAGGGGDDTLQGAAGNDTLQGGAGNDVLVGGAGADTLDGGLGADTASYAATTAAVTINLGSTSAQGGSGEAAGDVFVSVENLVGTSYDDLIVSGAAANSIDGGAGIDTVSYTNSALGVVVDLSLVIPQISTGDAGGDLLVRVENLAGSSLADSLLGDAVGNRLAAGQGNDTLEGRAGADTLDGGAGQDLVSYASSNAGVSVDLGRTLGQLGAGDVLGDVYVDIEGVLGSAHDDTIASSANADAIDGNLGTDTVSYAASTAAVTVDLALTSAQESAGTASGDVLTRIEVVAGSTLADTLRGDASGNALQGGLGNDTLEGRAGADTLTGGDGSDTASYSSSAVGVTVDLSLTGAQTSAGDASGDRLAGIENLSGSSLDDVLRGDAAANLLWGQAGHDSLGGAGGADLLIGGAGDDVLQGGAGADTLNGGAGADWASYSDSTAGVTVDLGRTLAQTGAGDVLGDVFVDVENLLGSAFDDLIVSGAAANAIDAGAGIDTVSYAGSTIGVTVDLSVSTMQISEGTGSGDQIANVENLLGSSYGDTLRGAAGADRLGGGGGDDTLE
ncbi:MAG: beta strand repeat-containing protein, partial [Burkholderiaceae bacterium]